MINDLIKGNVDPEKVVLIIFDEAHHAQKNYAYCHIINFLERKKVAFRIVGLSATPGNNNNQV